MPIYSHECASCGHRSTGLYKLSDPAPPCCGDRMRRLVPRGVVGRCVPDSNGAHAGSGFAKPSSEPPRFVNPAAELVRFTTDEGELEVVGDFDGYEQRTPETRFVSTPIDHDPNDPNAIAPQPSTGPFAKDYEDCTADERDARWRDGAQALAAWTANQLEAKGASPTKARDQATEAAQQAITKARGQASREDGLT